MSKLTRVRVEFFSKIIASTWPASGASASALALGPAGARRLAVDRIGEDRGDAVGPGVGRG